MKASAGNNTDNPNVFRCIKLLEEQKKMYMIIRMANLWRNPAKYGEAGKSICLLIALRIRMKTRSLLMTVLLFDFVATKRMVVEQDDFNDRYSYKDGN